MADQVGLLRRFWDEHAQEWINWVRSPGHQDSYWRFHRESFFSLLPDPHPKQLTIDVGCGEGRVGRDLKKRGHKVDDYKVLGVDCSLAMCQAAASHPKPSPTIVGDAVRLPLADASADCAIAFMSLQDIDDMPGAIIEVARVLKDGQHFALAITHPMYSGGEFSDGGKGKDDEFVIRGSYFKTERYVSKGVLGDLTMAFYREHRPLEAYTRALNDAGFSIERLHEVTDEDEGKRLHRVPMFLDILATRRPRPKPVDSAKEFDSNHSDEVELQPHPDHAYRKGAKYQSYQSIASPSSDGILAVPRVFPVRGMERQSDRWPSRLVGLAAGLAGLIDLLLRYHP